MWNKICGNVEGGITFIPTKVFVLPLLGKPFKGSPSRRGNSRPDRHLFPLGSTEK